MISDINIRYNSIDFNDIYRTYIKGLMYSGKLNSYGTVERRNSKRNRMLQ